MAKCPKCQVGVLTLYARIYDVYLECASCHGAITAKRDLLRRIIDAMIEGGEKVLESERGIHGEEEL